MKNKKILMVVLNDVYFDSRVIREYKTLVNKGFLVNIIGIKSKRQTGKSSTNIKLFPLLTRYLLPKNKIGWAIKYFEYFFRSIFFALKRNFYVIHCHDLPALFPMYFVSLIKKTKLIYDSHELYTETKPYSDIINETWKIIERFLIKRVSSIIAANKSRALIMKKEYGAPNMPIIIKNIPDVQEINKSDKLTRFLNKKNIFDKRIVLYQGGNFLSRNIDLVIKSIPYWKDNLVFVLMGHLQKNEEKVLCEIIAEYDLKNRVFFHKPVLYSSLLEFTSSADIGIVIYRNDCRNNYYCAPNKLYEYAAAKIKIAGCDFPEVKEIIEKYEIGLTFSPDSIISISNCINNLDAYDLDEKHIRKLFLENNWKIEQKKLLSLYDKFRQ